MFRFSRSGFLLCALLPMVLASASAALAEGAENTVSQEIHPSGTVTAEFVHACMHSTGISTDERSHTGTLTLNVNDLRGSAAGWFVSVISSDEIVEGASSNDRNVGSDAPGIRSAAAPYLVAGQPVVATGPHFDPLHGASLDVERAMLWAAPGSGSGEYEEALRVIWNVPTDLQAGSYPAILTVTVSSAP